MGFRGIPVGTVPFATPTGTVDIGDVAVQGVGPAAASSQHVHPVPVPGAGTAQYIAVAPTEGTASAPARANHVHGHRASDHQPGGFADLSGLFGGHLPATEGIRYVTANGNDANDGTGWTFAKATVQAAIDALPATGGIVLVGAGVFTSPNPITYRGNVAIVGTIGTINGLVGVGATRLVYTGTGDAITSDTTATGWIPSVQLLHLQIDTNGTTNLAASAIHVWNAHDLLIEDVVIGGNFTDAIVLGASAINGDTITLRNVRVEPFGGGRTITRGLHIPAGSQYNAVVIDRVLFNIGDASGTALGRGDSCIRIDGVLLNAVLLNPAFITATNGFATFGAGQAANVTVIAPHFEGAIVNQFNLVNANDQVMVFGGPGGGVGGIGAFPGQGLLVRSDGRITTGRDDRPALRVMRANATQTANIVQYEKQDFNPVWTLGPKGQVIMQPDETANPLLWVIGPAGLAANLAEFRNNAGTTLAIRSDCGLAHPAAAGLGFYGANPVNARPAVAGSRAGNGALASLLTQLAAIGLITDNTTANNPDGATAVVVGASPWTYTNTDAVDELLYVRGGSTVSATKNGQTVIGIASNVAQSINVEPGESLIITYAVAPTVTVDKR